MVVSSPGEGDGVAVVTEMSKDLRLAAELGTSLLNANEALQQQLREALERERALSEHVADLRRKLASSDEEILALSAELAELHQARSAPIDEGRTSRMEKSLQAVLSTIHADQKQLQVERKAIADQAEAIRARESERCRDIEAIRTHCFQLESRVDTMSMANALLVLKSYARVRRLEEELNDTKIKLLQAQTQLRQIENSQEESPNPDGYRPIRMGNIRRLSAARRNASEQLSSDDRDDNDERHGNDVLLDFFFLTAMACKIDLVERGLSAAASAITNEELYESLAKEATAVPFYRYHYWVRSQLAAKMAPEPEKRAQLSLKETSWSSHSFWRFFLRR